MSGDCNLLSNSREDEKKNVGLCYVNKQAKSS